MCVIHWCQTSAQCVGYAVGERASFLFGDIWGKLTPCTLAYETSPDFFFMSFYFENYLK